MSSRDMCDFEIFQPQFRPPLGGPVIPAAKALRTARTAAEGEARLAIALERPDGSISRLDIPLLPAAHPLANLNPLLAERTFKFFLWQRGGYKAYVGGLEGIGRHIQKLYSSSGARAFDLWEGILTAAVLGSIWEPRTLR